MVPSRRLLIGFALVVVPFVTLAALFPVAASICYAIIALFSFAVFVDAIYPDGILNNLCIRPFGDISVTKGKSHALKLEIDNSGGKKATLRVAIPFPDGFVPTFEEMIADLQAGIKKSIVDWPFRACSRGNYQIAECYVEHASILGLWNKRRSVPLAARIVVYPNLLEKKKDAALVLLRNREGTHNRNQAGKGKNFEKLREYTRGDSFHDIHWKVTAKRRQPVSKVFQLERNNEVYLALDCSRFMARVVEQETTPDGEVDTDQPVSSANESFLEKAITATLLMAMSAEKEQDQFGLLTFSDQVHQIILAGSGRAHFLRCRSSIFDLAPRLVTPDFGELISTISLKIRKRALIFFVTCLDDPLLSESFLESIDILTRKHRVIVISIKPKSIAPLFSSEVHAVDDIYEGLSGHFESENLLQLEQQLRRKGARFMAVQNEKLVMEMLSAYFNLKNEGAL